MRILAPCEHESMLRQVSKGFALDFCRQASMLQAEIAYASRSLAAHNAGDRSTAHGALESLWIEALVLADPADLLLKVILGQQCATS